MPAFGNLTLADGQTTPVNHTFYATDQNPLGVFNYVEQTASSAIGYLRLAWSLRSPVAGQRVSSSDRVYKAKQTLKVPTMESTSAATGSGIPPAPTVAYWHSSSVEYTIPERGTLQERKDLHAYTRNGIGHADFTTQVTSLQPMR